MKDIFVMLAAAHQAIPLGMLRDDDARAQERAIRTSGLDMTAPRGSVMSSKETLRFETAPAPEPDTDPVCRIGHGRSTRLGGGTRSVYTWRQTNEPRERRHAHQSIDRHYPALPEDLDAAVIYYGPPVTDAVRLEPLSMPIQGHFGAADSSIPPAQVRRFKQALNNAGKDHEIHIYEGAGHAFANPSGTRYEPQAAQRAWKRTLDFLDRTFARE